MAPLGVPGPKHDDTRTAQIIHPIIVVHHAISNTAHLQQQPVVGLCPALPACQPAGLVPGSWMHDTAAIV